MTKPEDIFASAIHVGLNRKWHTLRAKIKVTQCLLVHTLNVMSSIESIGKITELSEKEITIALGAGFIHDAAKAKSEAQQVLTQGKGIFFHKDSDAIKDEELKEMLNELGIVDETCVKECIAIARSMEELESATHLTDLLKMPPRNIKLVYTVMLADEIASLGDISSIKIEGKKIERTLAKLGLHLYYYKVSVIRGILTQLLHRTMRSLIEAKGGIPLFYYPSGTLFISKIPIEEPQRKEIQQSLEKEINNYINKIDPIKIGKAIFGGITQTVILAPELLSTSNDAIKAFWSFISKQRFIQNPQLPPRNDQKRRWLRLISDKFSLQDEPLIEEKFKEIRAVLYLTQILKEIYKISQQNKAVDEIIITTLASEIGLSRSKMEILLPALLKVSLTTQAEEGISIYEELVTTSKLYELRRSEIIDKIVQSYTRITFKLFEENLFEFKFPTTDIAELLIKELEKPFMLPVKEFSDSISRNYSNGKMSGGISCALCSSAPDLEAPSSLVGEGTEAFTNFVKGGTRLGGRNKVKICKLCSYEAKIRGIFLKDPEETIFVFPQVQIGAQIGNVWQELINKLLTAQYDGIRALQDLDSWSTTILQGKLNESTSEIFKVLSEKSSGWSSEVIKNKIQNDYSESVEDFLRIFNLSPEENKYKTIKELSEAIINKKIQLPKEVADDFHSTLADATRFSVNMETPNYIVVTLSGLRHKKESETSYFLRKLFLGSILARLFLSSVTFTGIPFEIKFASSPRGYLEVPRKIGLTMIYKKLDINDWITLEQIDEVLFRTAALIKIEKSLTRTVDIGKDSLYILSKESPGRILNRYLQATGDKHNSDLVLLIKKWTGGRMLKGEQQNE